MDDYALLSQISNLAGGLSAAQVAALPAVVAAAPPAKPAAKPPKAAEQPPSSTAAPTSQPPQPAAAAAVGNGPPPEGFTKKTVPATKAERRAVQEAQRAAKAAAAAGGGGAAPTGGDKKGGDKKGEAAAGGGGGGGGGKKSEAAAAPAAKQGGKSEATKVQQKKQVVSRTFAHKQVALFAHLPQYEKEESISEKAVAKGTIHPSVLRFGLELAEGVISGTNARVVGMLRAFQQLIRDFVPLPNKVFARELDAALKTQIQFLVDCRPPRRGPPADASSTAPHRQCWIRRRFSGSALRRRRGAQSYGAPSSGLRTAGS